MKKPDFNAVIDELRTDLIVFLDDDFLPVTNVGEILYHFLSVSDIDFELVIHKINAIDPGIAAILQELRLAFLNQHFEAVDHDWFKAGEIITQLNAKELDAISHLATAFIETQEPFAEFMSTLAMNTGLLPAAGAVIYRPFIDLLNQYVPRKSVRIYRQLGGALFNEFEADLNFTLEKLPNRYFLFIVDKILGAGNDGRNIISDLRERDNGIHTFFSVLFTSQADPGKNPDEQVEHYTHFEIQKPAPDQAATAVELVAGGLSMCAYATFFNRVFELKKQALEVANGLVSNAGKANMLYLAEMATAEGTTVFRTIDQWFDLLVQKKVYDSLVAPGNEALDYEFITGLTSLINESFIPSDNGTLDQAFIEELQQLSNFELFNNAINQLFYPPAPGDIYQIENGIFILAGQDCDLIVREDNKTVARKEKFAELVSCQFIPKPLDDKKADSNLGLSLNYFYHNGQHGTLEIQFNKRRTMDFRLLDLCSLNQEGEAYFNAANNLSRAAKRSLPVMWQRYYPKLIEELGEKIKIKKFLIDENIGADVLSGDMSYALPFNEADGNVSFPLKRATRLKGQFKEYFLQRYWEYKTRKGLNTIGLYNRKPVAGSVSCGFYDVMNEVSPDYGAWVQLTGNREKNKKVEKLPLILTRATLEPVIPGLHKDFFNQLQEDEIVLDKPDCEIQSILFKKRWIDNMLKVTIYFPFFNKATGKYFKGKDELSLAELFGNQVSVLQPGDGYARAGHDGLTDLFKNGKHAKIPLEYFEAGITIPARGWTIKLNRDNGILDLIQEIAADIDEQP